MASTKQDKAIESLLKVNRSKRVEMKRGDSLKSTFNLRRSIALVSQCQGHGPRGYANLLISICDQIDLVDVGPIALISTKPN